ncbi:hypothetical protein KKG22_01895 [Patescibacteria group bacterium]|nr:hypothetical protein [Patescibacteria group bacterium]MBU1721893.1 hypothetical protein [Patescibacteria group bacterium]MBU1900875.1 hypothetical protein [Patescibacteria group bacterium]
MFDDHQGVALGQIPPNLPIANGTEDIFAGTDPMATPAVPQMPVQAVPGAIPPEIPQAPPSALDAGILRPKQVDQMPSVDPVSPTVPPEPVIPQVAPAMEGVPPTTFEEPLIARTQHQIQEKIPMTGQAPSYMDGQISGGDIGGIDVLPQGAQDDLYRIKEPALSRGIMSAIIIVVVVAILGGGGFWIYQSFIVEPTVVVPAFQEPLVDTTLDEEFTTPVIDEILNPVEDNALNTTKTRENDILFGQPLDSDEDGLDDLREETLRTDPYNWDTDGDDLSDGNEVTIWKTDPLVQDSDGDTYLDGQEVKNGYNPAGPGRILEVKPISEPTNSVDLSQCTGEDILLAVETVMLDLDAQGYSIPAALAQDITLLQKPELWEDLVVYNKVVEDIAKQLAACARIPEGM